MVVVMSLLTMAMLVVTLFASLLSLLITVITVDLGGDEGEQEDGLAGGGGRRLCAPHRAAN